MGGYGPRAGHDFIGQGMSGMMDLTGDPDGPAQKMDVVLAVILTGFYAVIGIQAALAERERSGWGSMMTSRWFRDFMRRTPGSVVVGLDRPLHPEISRRFVRGRKANAYEPVIQRIRGDLRTEFGC